MRKKTEKGFTIVEILLSFSLAIIVLIYIFNVLAQLKNLYTEDGIRSQLLVKQSGVVKEIENEINGKTIESIVAINDISKQGHRILFSDGSNADLYIDSKNRVVTFGEHKVQFIEGTEIGLPVVRIVRTDDMPENANNAVAFISFSIKHKLVDGDYGIRVAYPFDDRVNRIPEIGESTYISVSLRGYVQNVEKDSETPVNKNVSLKAITVPAQDSNHQYTYKFEKLENGTWKTVYTGINDTFVVSEEQRESYRVNVITAQGDASSYSNSYGVWIDKTPPTCEIGVNGTLGDNGWYKTNSINLSLTYRDNENGSNVSSYGLSTSSKVYNKIVSATQSDTKGTTWKGYVKDLAGNENTCSKVVKVDTKPPTCTVSGGNTTWIGGTSTRTITATCSDTGSECATTSFSHTYSATKGSVINTSVAGAININQGGSVKDNAGNVANCAANQTVRIDYAPPTCTVSGGNSTWTNGTRTIIATCSDVGSGCFSSTATLSHTYSVENGSYLNISNAGAVSSGVGGSVRDNVGNVTNCAANQVVKIDKKPPTCSITKKLASDKKSNTLTVSTSTKDGESGLHSTKPYKWGGKAWGTTNQRVVKQNGTYNLYVQDALGNQCHATAKVTGITATSADPPAHTHNLEYTGTREFTAASAWSCSGPVHPGKLHSTYRKGYCGTCYDYGKKVELNRSNAPWLDQNGNKTTTGWTYNCPEYPYGEPIVPD